MIDTIYLPVERVDELKETLPEHLIPSPIRVENGLAYFTIHDGEFLVLVGVFTQEALDGLVATTKTSLIPPRQFVMQITESGMVPLGVAEDLPITLPAGSYVYLEATPFTSEGV